MLTGETGAGKSILLDSLGLALGARADAGLVRAGAEQASVTACFAPPSGHPLAALLAEQGLEAEDEVVLRRVLTRDGRSRAFINDQPVGVALLRRAAALLVEVQGQHEQIGLADAASHAPSAGCVRGASGAARCDRSGVARSGGRRLPRWRLRARRSRRRNAMRNGCATRWMNWPGWHRSRARRSGWRRSGSDCSRASAMPRRSPRRWPN